MMRLKSSVLAFAVFCAVGCASQSSVMVSGAQPGQYVSKTQRSMLWGLIASDRTWDPRTECPNGIAKVDVGGMFSLLGIYASYYVQAWCAAGPAAISASQPSGTGSVIILR
jgi:hypothetical protein